jgi:GT2 family glycosyltransferase
LRPAKSTLGGADCTVVVCAHTLDRWEHLRRAIDSLEAQIEPPRQIVVVIDHNDELEVRARRAFPRALVIANDNGAGVSGARNAGTVLASGEIVAYLDDDATAARDWLQRLCAAYADEAIVGVGGSIVPAWETAKPCWFPDEYSWVVGCSYRGMPTTSVPVRNMIGANMSFRRVVFERVGLFDERFGRLASGPAGCDETEFCLRVRRRMHGSEILYEPAALVHHAVPAGRVRWRYFVDRCRGEGYSKAMISAAAGADGTSTERRYVLRTLPAGVARGLTSTVTTRNLDGVRRAGAIVFGLAVTSSAYVRGRVATGVRREAAGNPDPAIAA